MTIGTITLGDISKPGMYYHKQWSGTDDQPAHKAWNNYSLLTDKCTKTEVKVYNKRTGAFLGQGGLPNCRVQYASDNENILLDLLSRATDALRGHSFNAAISIAEAGQTAEFVGNTMISVFRFFRACKERKADDILRTFRDLITGNNQRGRKLRPGVPNRFRKEINSGDISGAILSTSYAWGPLISDCYSSIAAFEVLRAEKPRAMTFRTSKAGTQHTGNVSNWPANQVITGWWRKRIHITIRFKERLTLMQSLGFTNLASVVWEKTAFSFIGDYIIPIGAYLDNLGLLPRVSLEYCLTDTDSFLAQNKGPWKSVYVGENNTYYWTDGFFQRQTIRSTRTIGTKLDIPLPSIKHIEKVFSLGHVRNVAALFHQAFRQIQWSDTKKLPPKKVFRGWDKVLHS